LLGQTGHFDDVLFERAQGFLKGLENVLWHRVGAAAVVKIGKNVDLNKGLVRSRAKTPSKAPAGSPVKMPIMTKLSPLINMRATGPPGQKPPSDSFAIFRPLQPQKTAAARPQDGRLTATAQPL
jgi:hypothetical protein